MNANDLINSDTSTQPPVTQQASNNNDKTTENIEKIEQKAVDWWAQHNITTRTVIMVVLMLFAGTVIMSWFGKSISHFDKIIDVLEDTLLLLTVMIIAGVNSAPLIMEKIIKWKKGI